MLRFKTFLGGLNWLKVDDSRYRWDAVGRPTWFAISPPTTRIRPSGICSIPVQKMFVGGGTEWIVLVVGFQTLATVPNMSAPSYIRTLPLGRSTELTETIGKGTVPHHNPNWAGFLGLELEKVTEMGLAFAVLFAMSQADAAME
jgi:hypothetical protein